MHFGRPVAQAVHHQLQDARVPDLGCVAATGEINVATGIVRLQMVVAGVVDAAPGEGWSEMVSLGSVVVDDVQDDFDAGRVQSPDHRLEFLHHQFRIAGRTVPRVGGEESQCVVAPVIDAPLLDQEPFVAVVMDRQ